MKPFNRDKSSESGSNSSHGGGSGNNSDNSALVSLGNTSFGFNFDSEEGMNNSNNSEEGDSDGSNQGARQKKMKAESRESSKSGNPRTLSDSTSKLSSLSSSSNDAAAAAVANLQSIASESSRKVSGVTEKRKAQDTADNDSGGYNSGGYNSDDDGRTADTTSALKCQSMDQQAEDVTSSASVSSSTGQSGSKKKRRVDGSKREERNAREKERSFRISRQINELRNLLSTGGVIVPKGTKSSVLTEAANYIRMLQQHQYRSEIDRHQLVQQIQMIGGGALGQQAATAVRHVAAQNGVWSLGNFGGMPPKSAMMYHQPNMNQSTGDENSSQQESQDGSILSNRIDEPDYRYVFNSCTVGMAIASMGGAFIDCNKLFSELSNYTKQEICSMTIFNLTARDDLQHAFDLISQMLSAPADGSSNASTTSCVLRGAMKHRSDLGLSVTLIKGDDGVAKCFCVTLIRNPSHPFDSSRPVPATSDLVQVSNNIQIDKSSGAGLDPVPRYTTG